MENMKNTLLMTFLSCKRNQNNYDMKGKWMKINHFSSISHFSFTTCKSMTTLFNTSLHRDFGFTKNIETCKSLFSSENCVSEFMLHTVAKCLIFVYFIQYSFSVMELWRNSHLFSFCHLYVLSAFFIPNLFYFCRDEELTILRSRYNRLKRNFRLGFPPVTPNACAKDTLFSQLFDIIWTEVSVLFSCY